MDKFIKQLTVMWSRDIDLNVDGDVYKAAFLGTEAGKKVLEDLIRFYYMQPSVNLSSAYEIAFEQGQRQVVHYIMRKLTTIEEEEINDE